MTSQELTRQFLLLSDESRYKRKRALEKIKEETVEKIETFEQDTSKSLLVSVAPHMTSGLFDPIEKHRETSLEILSGLILNVDDISESLPVIIPSVAKRLGQQEMIESSEEIRLSLITLLTAIIRKSGINSAAFIDEYIRILLQTLVDPYPEVKKASCHCANILAKTIPQYFYMHSDSLIKPLIAGITHQHSKVRTEMIKTIGIVIQYGNGKSVDDIISHLAQRLFDQSPHVRKAVIEIVGGWLLDLMDRYSFHHKLIPLLLTGCSDEIQEIQMLANNLWYDIGMKYAKENEEELKDKMNFEKTTSSHYPKNTERPNLGCRTLIFRHVSKILPGLMGDLGDWVNGTRVKAAGLLSVLALNAEECLTQHAEIILTALAKGMLDEEKDVRESLEKSAELLGYFVEPKVWWKLLNAAIHRADRGTSYLAGALCTLACVVRGSEAEQLVNTQVAEQVAATLAEEDVALSLVAEVKWQTLHCVDNVIDVLSVSNQVEALTSCCHDLFYTLLSVLAVNDPRQDAEVTQTLSTKSRELLGSLAQGIQLPDTESLFRLCLPQLLTKFKSTCDSWIAQSGNRYVFDALLLESGPVVGEFLDDIMHILVTCLDKEKLPELKLKFFMLLARLVANTAATVDSQGLFRHHISCLVGELILPNFIWRGGRTAEAVRKIAVTCLWAVLVGAGAGTSTEAHSGEGDLEPRSPLSGLSPSLLGEAVSRTIGLLEDDLSSTRLLACRCLVPLLETCGPMIADGRMDRDPLHQDYPAFLKRMDDADDEVRIAATRVFLAWLAVLGPKFDIQLYKAHLDDLYAGLLIHLDDPESTIQAAVLEVLVVAGRLDKDQLSEAVNKAKEKHRSPHLCQRLMKEVMEA